MVSETLPFFLFPLKSPSSKTLQHPHSLSMATQTTNPNSSASSSSSQQITTSHSISDSLIQINLSMTTKLDRSNYLTWKSQIHPLLLGYDLAKYIEGNSPPPTITSPSSQLDVNQTFFLGINKIIFFSNGFAPP